MKMSDLMLNAVVIVGTLAVVGLIFIITSQSKKRQDERIQALARGRGWDYAPIRERLSSGYRLQGRGWTMEALTWSSGHSPEPAQSDISQHTHIRGNTSNLPAGLILIGPWSGSVPDLGEFGRMMMNKIIERYLGVVDADLQEVTAGSADFQKKYKIFVQNANDATAILSLEVEQALTGWKGPLPVIKISGQVLRIEVDGKHYKTEAEILALSRLAEMIMSYWEK
jgi:hypothetical protein